MHDLIGFIVFVVMFYVFWHKQISGIIIVYWFIHQYLNPLTIGLVEGKVIKSASNERSLVQAQTEENWSSLGLFKDSSVPCFLCFVFCILM